MLEVKHILPLLARQPAKPVTFDRTAVIAAPELQSTRLAICHACRFNVSDICRQCCGGVPVKTLVNLTASRCARHYW
jgi:hypothetical protein